ncbi:MAG: homoserine kinase [Betaproteobacteria bacterium]|nr:homoserine kinase [Betaproteobacteria bacterium]
MAVFTPIQHQQLAQWLDNFDLGELLRFEGIASGIENSNFFVDTASGRFVLTLFERLSATQLPYYIDFMTHLAEHGVACPKPITNRSGLRLGSLAGKPAALVTCLPGRANMQPAALHCAAVGHQLARMHLAARSYPKRQANLRGLAWWQQVVPMLEPFVSNERWDLLQTELKLQISFQASKSYGELPNSAVHADLFRDNVLFDGEQLGGMIDFYFAGDDTWLFDLAVTCNDWCTESASGAWDQPRLHALLDAYCRTRTPLEAELEAWPFALRAAAFRFWVSRLFDLYLPREASLLTPKDPSQFERVLIARHGDHQLASLRESIARVDQASTTAAS